MNLISIIFLGFAMATDAFAAAIGKGAAMDRPRFSEALRAGLIFGVVEAITPLIGWLIGSAASSFVAAWDHWIAFGLLLALGLHMIHQGLKPGDDDSEDPPVNKHGTVVALAITGFATSIDAMAVGVGLAFIQVNIVLVSAIIGLCTFTMVTIGIMLGRALGAVIGKRAELIGGVILILVGATILYEHLHQSA